ncbi:MAG: hypothetical protein HC918_03075 [Oscillatoriales cyanobacterium SM2_1_8]|nr:hypothetical protein [Oscillatoriales cyanobacterium SM2_1_8]
MVVAAIALSLVPIPPREPVEETVQTSLPVPTQPQPSVPPPPKRDPATVARLQQEVFAQLDRAWRNPITFAADAVYIVRVSETGAIVVYEPTPETAAIAQDRSVPLDEELPLKSLQAAADIPEATQATFAFRVTFRVNEQLVVEPIDP